MDTDDTNDQQIAKIMAMNPHELLSVLLTFPEGMTDPYYRYSRNAVMARTKELGFA